MSPDGTPPTPDHIDSLADVVNGGTGADIIFAGLGNDTLNSAGGNDRVFAGAGDDVVSGGSGDDLVDGGAGNDILQGEAGADTLLGGAGADILFGGAGSDLLDGEDGDDRLFGGNEADNAQGDILRGGAGQDALYGEGGRDTLDGGAGGDRLDGGSGNDSLFGGEGADALGGGTGADTLDGGAGADGLDGGAGDDLLTGGAGADTLNGGAGAETLLAGAGDDLAIYRFDPGQTSADSLIGGEGADTLRLMLTAEQFARYRDLLAPYLANGLGGASIDFSALGKGAGSIRLVASGFETLEIYLDGVDTKTEQRRDGVFTSAADAVDFDMLDAGSQPTFNAGDGNDVVMLASRAASVAGYDDTRFFLAGKGNDAVSGRDRDDKIDAGAGNDTLWGGAGNDTLLGGAGADRLLGEGGVDSVDAGAGNDAIGLAGADTAEAFDGLAYVTLQGTVDGGAGADRLEGASRATLVAYNAERDNIRNIESFSFGSGADDLDLDGYGLVDGRYSISMGAGDDFAYGTRGHDAIRGGTGYDWLEGDRGRDTLLGEGGYDRLSGGADADLLNGGDGDDELFGGDGDDVLFGEAGDDALFGGAGSDVLYGGAGNDWLNGSMLEGDQAVLFGDDGDDLLGAGGGQDVLFGGAGADSLTANGGDRLFGDAGADDLDATFSSGANSLYGGTGEDTLAGGFGDDSIDGGEDGDIVVYGGFRADYAISYDAATDSFSVRDLRPVAFDGTDTVRNVESFRFADGTRTAEELKTPINHAPVVTGPVIGDAVKGASVVTLDALAKASDADAGTTLQVTDLPTDLPSGVSYDAATYSFTLDPMHPAYVALAEGETRVVSIAYKVSDGIAKTDALVSWTVTGTGSRLPGYDKFLVNTTTAGNDTFTGGVGLDTFVIQQGFGRDVITDFGASPDNQDLLQVSSAVFADMQAFMAAARQVGTDIVITATPNDVLTLKNVALSSLDAADLRFVP